MYSISGFQPFLYREPLKQPATTQRTASKTPVKQIIMQLCTQRNLLATPPKNGSRPSEGRKSRLKTTTRRSINPLHKFYAVKLSCIHGARNYKATGTVRKTSYVLFLSEKKNEVRLFY